MAAALRTHSLTHHTRPSGHSLYSEYSPPESPSVESRLPVEGERSSSNGLVLSSVHVGLASRATSYVRVCHMRSTYCSTSYCMHVSMCFLRDLCNRFRP